MAHCGELRNDGGGGGNFRRANPGRNVLPLQQHSRAPTVGCETNVCGQDQGGDRRLVLRRNPCFEHFERRGAVSGSAIEVGQPQELRQLLRYGAFSCSGWTIDGNDQRLLHQGPLYEIQIYGIQSTATQLADSERGAFSRLNSHGRLYILPFELRQATLRLKEPGASLRPQTFGAAQADN